MNHGLSADSPAWLWALFLVSALVFLWVLWLAVRWTFFPGETEADHVKRSILRDDEEDDAPDGAGIP